MLDEFNFGKYLIWLREKAGHSQASLAKVSGVWNSTIARIESGQTSNPDPSTLEKLAPFLKVSKEELLIAAGYSERFEKIGRNLKELRTEKGLSKNEIANKLNISVEEYNLFELGIRHPHPGIVSSLSLFYDVSTDYLTGFHVRTHCNEPYREITTTVSKKVHEVTPFLEGLSDEDLDLIKSMALALKVKKSSNDEQSATGTGK